MLLREGTLVSLYVFGGMGGGKNSKPRVFEPGNLLKVEARGARSGHTSADTLQTVSEHSLLWQATHIRHNPQGFALACLYLEMVLKTALPHDTNHTEAHREHEGLFNVVSNGLFYLDQALGAKSFQWESHLALFLAKFLLHLGILPDERECVLCGAELAQEVLAPLVIEQGGFACSSCAAQVEGELGEPLPLRGALSQAVRTRFSDWGQIPNPGARVNMRLIQFWCYHFHIKLPDVTSYRLLFAGL